MPDFRTALDGVSKSHSEFLMVGRRWDIEISEPWDFTQADWDRQLRSLALLKGKQQGPGWVDYFCFSAKPLLPKDAPFGNWPLLVGPVASLEGEESWCRCG